MGTFTDSRAALDEAYATGTERIGMDLDGQAPPPAMANPVPAQGATAATPPVNPGPGFFARLGTGIAAAAGRTVDLVGDLASRVQFQPISGAQANAASQLVPPPRQPAWGLILAGIAALAVLVAILTRRP
jgi:hypothetical protein